jgi:hypothetical protein
MGLKAKIAPSILAGILNPRNLLGSLSSGDFANLATDCNKVPFTRHIHKQLLTIS